MIRTSRFAIPLVLALALVPAARGRAQEQDGDLTSAAAARLADLQQGGEPDPGVGALADAVRSSPLPRRRVRALKLLVEIAREAELPATEDAEARRSRYAGRLRNLLATALADPEPRVRRTALRAVRDSASRGAPGVDAFIRSRLLPRLRDETDVPLRLALLELSFELASDAELADRLASAAASDPDPDVRARALELHPGP